MVNCSICGWEYDLCRIDGYGDPVCDNCWTLTCDICGLDDTSCAEMPNGTMMCDTCYYDEER